MIRRLETRYPKKRTTRQKEIWTVLQVLNNMKVWPVEISHISTVNGNGNPIFPSNYNCICEYVTLLSNTSYSMNYNWFNSTQSHLDPAFLHNIRSNNIVFKPSSTHLIQECKQRVTEPRQPLHGLLPHIFLRSHWKKTLDELPHMLLHWNIIMKPLKMSVPWCSQQRLKKSDCLSFNLKPHEHLHHVEIKRATKSIMGPICSSNSVSKSGETFEWHISIFFHIYLQTP